MHDTPEKESAYTALEYRLKVVDLANVQMGRMYRQLKEERDAIQQQLELKESEYQSAIDKVNIATKIAQEIQQQNKQLIETIETVSAYIDKGWYATAADKIDESLQQIQGKDDER